eukprot:223901_1
MTIPDGIKQLIDTPHVQRLRYLKQLGTSYMVFPGASHNRFEHSIGVMWLAYQLLSKISDRQPHLHITDDELFCVSAAGLLHDLGHGPFSHVFDNQFIPGIKNNNSFKHEKMSVSLIEDLFVSNQIAIDAAHLELICALVSPSTHDGVYNKYKQKQRGFLFEIVANDLTGIDVDKWDYLLRDSTNVGIGISFKYDRLMEHARVINDHICWSDKMSFEIYEMFRTRYVMFKRVYSHKTGKSIEILVCDILKFADPVFDIIGKIDDCRQYLTLTDTILHRIELREIDDTKPGMGELRKAQELIRRLHRRDLYKCCGHLLLSPDDLVKFNPNTPEALIKRRSVLQSNEETESKECHVNIKIDYQAMERNWESEMYQMFEEYRQCEQENDDKRETLQSTDIVVKIMSLSFGIETQHPMERVFLYNSKKSCNSKKKRVCYQVHCDQIITMTGDNFKEVAINAYVKKSEWKHECQYIFTQFLKRKGIIDGDSDTNVHESSVLSPQIKKKSKAKSKKETLRQSDENTNYKKRLSATLDLMAI